MKKIILLLVFAPLFLAAQEGMKFEHGLSWKEIQAKAKAENKYIFMDCFTTWCGPCTYMTENIFPTKEAGAFFNANFINVKVQFDTTKNDNEEVKKWFPDMEAINARYKIRAYPTYLMFNPNGEAVHRAVGSSPVEVFVEKGKDAMDPAKQYYPKLKKYEEGDRSAEFLKSFALIAQGAYDLQTANTAATEYIATLTDVYTKDNLEFISKFTSSSKDQGFALMLNNAGKVNAVLGPDKAEQKVMAILLMEKVYPALSKGLRAKKEPNWDSVQTVLAAYPGYREEALAKGKIVYYQNAKDWSGFQATIVAYMEKYGAKASPAELNNYAWTVFENCKDMSCVAQAMEWSKRSFRDKPEPMYMDTYANILHKMGRTQEAIAVQEKAVVLADDKSRKTYQDTLEKMKKGEKTWVD
ncbi:thioredoxin family protein [Sediminibacterium soli]|uniref:thioredoxin family protein n=1 Tax=Sediminibacterium soli TaxID=2698829 RepID=UPI00137B3401|nr:thioredoxin fold domain-containing protein [Sediminibacterium soli]NCI46204.1 thioredoxin fold domain-containing protein [Sediminibacterium soli]